jgi:hypothetical protein
VAVTWCALASCSEPTPSHPVCTPLCTELVNTCGYEAFPSVRSCLEGCAFDEAEGVDILSKSDCMFDAACDIFSMLDCEVAYPGAEAVAE